MKTKLILKTMGLLFLTASLFSIGSCSKNADESLTKEQKALQDSNIVATAIDDKDFTESYEDLITVDYKEFYDQLAPHGEWMEVSAEELGLKTGTSSNKSAGNNNFTISNMLGVKSAYADANVGMVFVWKPSPTLAVYSTPGETQVYTPYTNGQWVNTDAGWYFKAPTPYEETVSHYGRWVNSPTAGWLWVPGRVWAPAWVDWRQNDEYVSWAPLPPSSYLVNNIINVPVIDDNNYVIVRNRYFLEPNIYTYYNPYYDNGNRVLVSDLTRTDGIVIINNTILNRGPNISVIQTAYGRNIELVSIQRVRNYSDIRYSDREYVVYSPNFIKYKHKNNPSVRINAPKSYKKYDDWKELKTAGKEYNKEVKQQEKEYKKEVKQQEKEIKKENKGNNNGKKENVKQNNKKNSGNENVKEKKINNQNNNKSTGKENIKKNDNQNNNKGNETKDNGSKNNTKNNGKSKK